MQNSSSSEGDDSNTLYLKLWLQMAKCSKTIEQEMEARFQKNFKQSLSRFDVMSQLNRCKPDRLPMGKLAQQLIASKGNITRLVDRMISEGLLDRQPGPEDRRVIQVGLTPKGQALFDEMAGAHAQWAEHLLNKLNLPDSHQLLDLLTRINREFSDESEP